MTAEGIADVAVGVDKAEKHDVADTVDIYLKDTKVRYFRGLVQKPGA